MCIYIHTHVYIIYINILYILIISFKFHVSIFLMKLPTVELYTDRKLEGLEKIKEVIKENNVFCFKNC